ncbi:MAG: hypothetical protein ACR2MA_01760 [Egibacteraceae bacterium]
MPASLDGLELTSLGPVDAEVRDSAGRRGGNELPAPEIPGLSSATGARNSTFFLTRDDQYHAEWTATADGDFTLQLRSVRHDRVRAVRSLGPVRVCVRAPASVLTSTCRVDWAGSASPSTTMPTGRSTAA